MPTFYVPSKFEFEAGLDAYKKKETRGPVYFKAAGDIRRAWGNPEEIADAIWLLLRSWHRQFYRFGPLDVKVLASCIASHAQDLDRLRSRDILDFSSADELTVKAMFRAFAVATRRVNKSGFQESTVAVAKALHLLAPDFLPLWDNPIARHYGCLLR